MTQPFIIHTTIKPLETLAFAIVWLGVFSIPVIYNHIYDTILWDNVIEEWIHLLGFFLIFLINVSVCVPALLFRKLYIPYILGTLAYSGIIICLGIWLLGSISSKTNIDMPPMEIGPGMPPMELSSQMPPPMGFKPNPDQYQNQVETLFLNNFLIAMLVVAASTSLKLFSRWLTEEGKLKEIEKQQLKNELAMLRNQASPHFLMNTLNNIHALIDIDAETAKDAVIRLSTLMRYLLYDSSKGKTSLQKEIDFIESYFTLMKLRFAAHVALTLDVPDDIPDIQIPPLIFITFLENAFKHGVSYKDPSFVLFRLAIENKRLNCTIQNSKPLHEKKNNDRYSGIGLANVRKSLELMYPADHTLEIIDEAHVFIVNVSIPVQNGHTTLHSNT